jgi:DNA-binding NarL/FixJ family response regulator
MITIIVVENKDWMRNGLCGLLNVHEDFNIVGVGRDGCDALQLCEELKPDVIIINTDLPFLNGLKLTHSLGIRSPDTAVIIIGKEASDAAVIDFVSSGAASFLLEDVVYSEICAAVRRVILEKCYFLSNSVTSKVVRLYSTQLKSLNSKNGLQETPEQEASQMEITRTELRIASFVGEGMTNKEIAKRINLNEGTVRNYISSILQKTGLQHRTQIAIHVNSNSFTVRDARRKHILKQENVPLLRTTKPVKTRLASHV